MNSVPSDLLNQIASHPKCKILESRSQYRSCHIHVPTEHERLPAIQFNGRCYSFFKVLKNRSKTLQTAARLVYRGDEVAVTTTVKGDILWIYEPDATVVSRRSAESRSPLWRILESEQEYTPCQIRVPDVASALTAIYYDRNYYALLRTVRERSQAIDLAERLAKKGHGTLITKQVGSDRATWAVWVLETEVSLYS